MTGLLLSGLPIRTRSKVVKEHICHALGYPVPPSFKRVQPRFTGQCFDTYTQKSNNLQIWNEQLVSTRRYVIVKIGSDAVVTKIRAVTGDTLALLDTTGTLTQKYQARLILGKKRTELVAKEDTERIRRFVRQDVDPTTKVSSLKYPRAAQLLPIRVLFERLKPLIGKTFRDVGKDQERKRGTILHKLVCKHLGYADYRDDGQFPDVLHQLLEVKLQTSPTIDLGLASPDSKEYLDIPKIGGQRIRYCDVRYALFYAAIHGRKVTLTHLFIVTGEMFFTRFQKFKGKVVNNKIQIKLPNDFF